MFITLMSPDFQKILLIARIGQWTDKKLYWKDEDFEVAWTRNCGGSDEKLLWLGRETVVVGFPYLH